VSGEPLRGLPSVDRLLREHVTGKLVATYGHEATVDALRHALDRARGLVREGRVVPGPAGLIEWSAAELRARLPESLRRVINATGVIIHTNLGRAPLARAAREAIDAVSRGYSTLEYEPVEGRRGHRGVHCEALLCELTGAESALVVNNNAGAVLLALAGLARGRSVVISRGQLVEIGGGFRIPDVLAQSGARLVEVGTTNRTHIRDYRAVLESDPDVALLLRAHHSNYRIVGFAKEPSLAELVTLGAGVPVLDDLGSGALLDTAAFGLRHEPTVQESVAAGAAAVCFSGDKLLGGPQAGILVGQARYVNPLKSHPLARALRADKMCLAGLRATLLHYLRGEAVSHVPVWRCISAPLAELRERARCWHDALRQAGVPSDLVDGRSTVGGGSLPGETLPTTLLSLALDGPDRLAAQLRACRPAVVARILGDRLVLDPRSVLPEEDTDLAQVLVHVCGRAANSQKGRNEKGP